MCTRNASVASCSARIADVCHRRPLSPYSTVSVIMSSAISRTCRQRPSLERHYQRCYLALRRGPRPHCAPQRCCDCRRQARGMTPGFVMRSQRAGWANHWVLTTRENGSLRMSRSVLFWYLLISRSATVPGLYRFSTRARGRTFSTRVVSVRVVCKGYAVIRTAWLVTPLTMSAPATTGAAARVRGSCVAPAGRPPARALACSGSLSTLCWRGRGRGRRVVYWLSALSSLNSLRHSACRYRVGSEGKS